MLQQVVKEKLLKLVRQYHLNESNHVAFSFRLGFVVSWKQKFDHRMKKFVGKQNWVSLPLVKHLRELPTAPYPWLHFVS